MEIRLFVGALQRFQGGQNPHGIIAILAVFAPQPRWRHEPWNGLFHIEKASRFLKDVLFKANF